LEKQREILKRDYIKKSGVNETIGLFEIIVELKNKGLFDGILDNDKKIKGDSLQYDSELHGANHTRRVAFNTTVIAMMEGESSHNIDLARTIANYHDIGRENDIEDEKHGEYSIKILEKNSDRLENLSDEDRNILSFVIREHCLSKIENDEDLEVIGIEEREKYKKMLDLVKDADKLDRVRLDPRGIYPREGLDVRRLSLESSKKLENFSYESFDKVLEYMDIANEIREIDEELSKLEVLEESQEAEKSNSRVVDGKRIEIPYELSSYFLELQENGINAYILEVSDGNKYIVIKNETSDDVLIEYKDKEEYVREKLLLNSYLSKNDDKRAEVTGSGEKVLLNLEENRCILLGIDDIKINGNDIIPIREAAKKLIEKETVKDKKGKKVVDFKNIGEKTVLQNHLLEYLYGKRINLSPDAMQEIKYYKNEKGEIDYRDINGFLRGEFSENHFNVEYVKNVVKSIIYLSKIAESMPVRKYDIMIGRKGNGKGGARNANNIGDKNNYDSFVSFGTNTGIALSCFSCMSYNRVLKSNDAAIPIGMLMKQMERCIR